MIMESWPSSWRTGSFSFVSPEDDHPSVRHLTTTTTDPDNNTSSHKSFLPSSLSSSASATSASTSSRRNKMAKIISVGFAILITTVVVGLVVADTAVSESDQQQPPAGRSRLRAKSLSSKKRRVSSRQSVPETTVSPPVVIEDEQLLNVEAEDVETTTTTVRPKSKKSSKSVQSTRPIRDSNVPLPEGCGECDMSVCKSYTDKSCQAGMVIDRCSCCYICGSGEGNRCYNHTIPGLPYTPDVGMCGTGLACILRKDLDPTEPREALCECRDRRLVCGNDNHTYSNECKLREAAYKSPGLSIASWGPCVSAPWIPTSIENITVADGEDASLSCEVKGFPSPIIHWEFLVYGSSGGPKILPGDDSSVVVTVRGGPEQTMSTSWIQIIAVTDERQGTYYCVATNSHGVARNYATVSISAERQQES